MVLRRWEPFAELQRMEDMMDRMMQHFFGRGDGDRWPRLWSGEWTVPVDVFQTDDHVVLKASVPGIRPEDLDISITGNTVTIKGEVKGEEEVKEENVLLRERRYGSFSRTITLPEGVDADRGEANYEHGVLTIRFPKREEVRPKSLKIHVGGQAIEGKKA